MISNGRYKQEHSLDFKKWHTIWEGEIELTSLLMMLLLQFIYVYMAFSNMGFSFDILEVNLPINLIEPLITSAIDILLRTN
jgi:hypothetical protein